MLYPPSWISLYRNTHSGSCIYSTCLTLGRSGELARAARAMVPSPLALGTHATVDALRVLHPPSPRPMPFFVEEFQPADMFILDKECFVRALRSSASQLPRVSLAECSNTIGMSSTPHIRLVDLTFSSIWHPVLPRGASLLLLLACWGHLGLWHYRSRWEVFGH